MVYKHYDVEVRVAIANVVDTSPGRAEQRAKNFIVEHMPGVPQLNVAVIGAVARELEDE